MAILTTYNIDELTGGGSRALDSMPVASLTDGDRALAVIDGAFIPFVFDSSATDAQDIVNRPYKVRPLDYSSAGVWVEQAVLTPGGFKNKIINGNFDFWQRGTSFSNDGYGADRWKHAIASGSGTTSRQSFTVGQTDVPGEPIYYAKLSFPGSCTNQNLQQYVENVRTLAGKIATISFYAKASRALTGATNVDALAAQLVQEFGSGGSDDVWGNCATGPLALTTSWQKFTATGPLPSISGKTLGTGHALRIFMRVDLASAADISIAQVQIEEGAVATPFEQRPLATELDLCQRYFQYNMTMSGAMNVTNVKAVFPFIFQVPMRATPTATVHAASGGVHRPGAAFYDISSISYFNGIYIEIIPSTLFGAEIPCQLLGNTITFDAEL